MKKSISVLSLITVLLIVVASISSTLGYFTDQVHAAGAIPIEAGGSVEMGEEFYEKTKHVTITGKKDSGPVFVRVMAIAGVEVTFKPDAGGHWKKGTGNDPYWYYDTPISGGESTAVLDITVDLPEKPDADENFDKYNVIVIQEYTPVKYDADGVAYGDWPKAGGEG